MRQIFVEQTSASGADVFLTEEQIHHLFRVLRMQEGDIIRVVTPEERVFWGILQGDKKKARVTLDKEISENRELPFSICLACAWIRRERMEWMFQKATELGVFSIRPLVTEYTTNREKHYAQKKERWEKILLEAAQQSERHRVPLLEEEGSLKDLFEDSNSTVLFCSERAEVVSLVDWCFARRDGIPSKVHVVIGPEGGFSKAEKQFLTEKGAIPVSLGPRILRAESAAILAAGLIAQIWE